MRKFIFYILQSSWFLLGLFLVSVSVVLMVQAELGPPPWDVLHLGLTNHLPFTLGQVMIGVGLIALGISWVLGVRPYIASIVNMFLIGALVDLILAWGWFPVSEDMTVRVVYMLVGVVVLGLGSAVYLSANLGSGPRDSLMVALYRITGWRISIVRTILEVAAVVSGYLLGGLVGIGTIIFSLTAGIFLEFFMTMFKRISQRPFFQKHILSLREPMRDSLDA